MIALPHTVLCGALAGALWAVPAPLQAPELLELPLGTRVADVEARLADWGLDPVVQNSTALLIEGPILTSVYDLQRSFLEFDAAGHLSSIDVQVVPDPGSNGADVMLLYENVKAELMRRLGRPAWERSEGSTRGGGVLVGLSNGTLIRYLQWEGEVFVRAGIPRRTDGDLIVEVLITARPIPRRQLYWGRELR